PQPEEPPPRPRSRRRMVIAATVLVLLVLAGLAVGREVVRNNYYVSEHDGTVSIMRGVAGSFLGLSLQEPYLLGCLNARNELSLISADQSRDNLACRLLGVDDMRPSERAQVIAGLPSGSLDEAIGQIEELSRSSVLPVCAAPAPTATASPRPAPTSAPRSPAPTSGAPETTGPSPDPRTTTAPAPTAPRTVTSSPAPPSPASPGPAAPPPGSPSPAPSPTPTVTAL
ncbi:serine/threonine protein phosphatase, partial [Mycobacterium sp. ITM-2017-0098]